MHRAVDEVASPFFEACERAGMAHGVRYAVLSGATLTLDEAPPKVRHAAQSALRVLLHRLHDVGVYHMSPRPESVGLVKSDDGTYLVRLLDLDRAIYASPGDGRDTLEVAGWLAYALVNYPPTRAQAAAVYSEGQLDAMTHGVARALAAPVPAA